ncbi:MAG: hypothetical protein CMO55_11375 [Verrucomicrobiales bacterium]|nr:hypothetical protein [Verrucomicrobiales bacterium]
MPHLTDEEALKLIKQHEQCYVVWATDRNTIVAVHPLPVDAKPEDRIKALGEMKTDYSGPTKGRFLSPATTTLQTLKDEAQETEQIARRISIFRSWEHQPAEELIEVIFNADFTSPMDPRHGTNHLVERLYKVHGPFLTEENLDRLRSFSSSEPRCPEQNQGRRQLICYLAVLTNSPDVIREVWRNRDNNKQQFWSALSAFNDAVGDLQMDDPEILEFLIEMVSGGGMFGPRFEAMVTLGKIGPAAGKPAATAIRDRIYDSSRSVVDVRERVLKRIESNATDWKKCPVCFHGYLNKSDSIPRIVACPSCFGLGHTQR